MPFKGVFPADKVTPAPNGLFSVASVTRHGGRDDHWAMGFAQESEACAFNASLIDICGAEAPINFFDTSDRERFVNTLPFGIVARDECLTPGWNVQNRKARVLRQLDLVTPKAVEMELWNGSYRQAADAGATTGMYLSSTAAEVIETGAQKPRVAMALLEQAIATCGPGFQATLHMTPLVTSMIGAELRASDDRLETVNGNLVAVGAGYDGRGPGEATAPTNNFVHWIYATGPVSIHLGTDELVTVDEVQATNAATNEMTYVAERPASVHWDGCCHFAVQVDVRL